MHSPREVLQYALGALLYVPATHSAIGSDICRRRYPQMKNIALCLEDSVPDHMVSQAEEQLLRTLEQISASVEAGQVAVTDLPLIFVRVRGAGQLSDIYRRLGSSAALLTGFILPKFDCANMHSYIEALGKLNPSGRGPYIMPIIESPAVIRRERRAKELFAIRQALDAVCGSVLNVRVGGTDFSNYYRLRRDIRHTIYDLAVVRDVLIDILNIFSDQYIISAPVWEYFGEEGGAWLRGLERELELDRLNGFVGKTAIHPCQLEPIQRAFVVGQEDYRDACAIANWELPDAGVSKSAEGTRMNEVKAHMRWAERTLALAHIYGVKE